MLALIGRLLLALVGYSAGAVAARRRNRPDVVDLVAAGGLLAAALPAGAAFGRWGAIGVAVAAGLLLGALVGVAKPVTGRLRSHRPGPHGDEAAGPEGEAGGLRARATGFAHALGDFQGRLLLALFFLTFVAPFALVLRLAGGGRARPPAPDAPTFWRPRDAREATLAEARRQF